MNHILEKFARQYLKEHITTLSEGELRTFKLMYSKRSIKEIEQTNILTIIDKMPIEKLDWAMLQVEKTNMKKYKGI